MQATQFMALKKVKKKKRNPKNTMKKQTHNPKDIRKNRNANHKRQK